MSKFAYWNSGIDGWQEISVESFQFVIEQAKERLEEEINEARTLGTRAMNILLSYVAALSGLASYIFTEHTEGNRGVFAVIVVVITVIFSIYVFTLLFAIISTKRKYFKGSTPKEIFKADVFMDHTPLIGHKKLLANEIERIEDKIQRIGSLNRKHINQYKSILRVSLILVAMFIFAVCKRFFSAT